MTTETTPRGWVPSDTFAARLVLARHQRRLTQQEAADVCGVSRATWALWEGGAFPRNMPQVISKIAAGMGIDRDWLMWGGPLGDPTGPNNGGPVRAGEATDAYAPEGTVVVLPSSSAASRYAAGYPRTTADHAAAA